MNRDEFQGKFREIRGIIKEKWGKLTDDEINQVNGNFDQLLGKLQQRYGYNRERAEEELRNWNPAVGAARGQPNRQQPSKEQREGKEKIKSR